MNDSIGQSSKETAVTRIEGDSLSNELQFNNEPGMARRVSLGVLSMSAAILASRLSLLVAQLVLGWILSKEDYAVYALAATLSAFVTALSDGGSIKVIVQKGDRYREIFGAAKTLAWAFNILCGFLLVPLAFWGEQFYGASELVPLMCISAVGIVLGTPASIGRALASVELRFDLLAKTTVISAVVRQVLTVFFALLNFGALSFVLPVLATSLLEWILLRRVLGSFPKGGEANRDALGSVFADSRWIILSAFASAMVLQGDYLVIGRMESKDVIANYFFGFQLTASVSALITSSLISVIMPAFARLNGEPHRQSLAFERATGALSTINMPICLGIVALAEPAIHFAWGGKWDEAIPVVQIIALSLTVRMLVPLGRALLEARGFWRMQAWLLILDGIGMFLAAWIGCLIGDLVVVAISVSLQRVVSSVVRIWIAVQTTDSNGREIALHILRPLGAFSLVGAATYGCDARLSFLNPGLRLGADIVVFLSLAALVTYFMFGRNVNELRRMLLKRTG